MHLFSMVLFAFLSLPNGISAKARVKEPPKPCTLKSTTNAFYDLSRISLLPLKDDRKIDDRHRNTSWTARGWDYGANFTLNICAPVVEELGQVQDLAHTKDSHNVSAFYTKEGKKFSIGNANSSPIFRGSKLVLNYTNGSLCPRKEKSRSPLSRKIVDDEDDDEDDGKDVKGGDGTRRKSTIISFLCQRDPTAAKAAVSFVGADEDCTYVFEIRTPYACEGASSNASQSGGVGPAGVFSLIVLIAVAAYIVGGIAYQRTVMHQRGWKQLPNYGTWASIWSFITDFFVIIFSSCTRCLPIRRGGYNQLPVYNDRSRFSRNEDENRLIDQLDEEWDD